MTARHLLLLQFLLLQRLLLLSWTLRQLRIRPSKGWALWATCSYGHIVALFPIRSGDHSPPVTQVCDICLHYIITLHYITLHLFDTFHVRIL